jgi:hypothetical protein
MINKNVVHSGLRHLSSRSITAVADRILYRHERWEGFERNGYFGFEISIPSSTMS